VRRLAVVKLGGSLGRIEGGLAAAGRALGVAARRGPLVVVPGGGVLADGVRALDRELSLPATTAHWMAILAMDQYAHVVAAHTQGAVIAHDAAEIRSALAEGRIPVLAPYRWMFAADVLPHRWEVTSDSIAAFVAGALDADLLVLLKPVGGPVETLTDPWFREARPLGLRVVVVGVDELDRLPLVVSDCAGGETAN
jgi:aspartokinase-like uncharacterized kinase